jgi:hypothetical protein
VNSERECQESFTLEGSNKDLSVSLVHFLTGINEEEESFIVFSEKAGRTVPKFETRNLLDYYSVDL